MVGNKNSGRRASFRDPVEIHFQMEREDVKVLNEIARKFSNNNRSELILKTLKKVIEAYATKQFR